MNVPDVYKLRIEILYTGVSSTSSRDEFMYCCGFSKEEIKRRIIPVLRYKEQKNKGVQLIIKEIWKLFELHYLSDEVVDMILQGNMKDFINKKKQQDSDELKGTLKRQSNISLL
jgi:hypothetical protein